MMTIFLITYGVIGFLIATFCLICSSLTLKISDNEIEECLKHKKYFNKTNFKNSTDVKRTASKLGFFVFFGILLSWPWLILKLIKKFV